MTQHEETPRRVLVLGATGKTGRRVAARLTSSGIPVRLGSRAAAVPFDWNERSTWKTVLENVGSVYIAYYPDLAIPGAADTLKNFTNDAVESGVRHLVLLAGRGETEADRCEEIVRDSGVDWTVLRPTWFNQNFSEGFMREAVLAGTLALPVSDTLLEPFVDVEDIADVAAAALTDPGRHAGETYELTGPRLMSFAEVAEELSAASGSPVTFTSVPRDAYVREMHRQGVPAPFVWLLDYLFQEVMDGRNSFVADGVERALGRPPSDFSDYARRAAATGVWHAEVLS